MHIEITFDRSTRKTQTNAGAKVVSRGGITLALESLMDARSLQQQREEEIERLAHQAGRLIGESEPETREQLAESAAIIMRHEARAADVVAGGPAERQRPMNPMAAGLGLILVGGGLTFLTPLVGLTLLVCGVLALVWGVVISATRQ